jgi:hypothetical protein
MYQVPYDPQTQPEVLEMAVVSFPALESGEETAKVVSGNARSVVLHDDEYSVRQRSDADLDRFATSVVRGISEKIRKHTLDRASMRANKGGFWYVQHDVAAFTLKERQVFGYTLANGVDEVDFDQRGDVERAARPAMAAFEEVCAKVADIADGRFELRHELDCIFCIPLFERLSS